MSLTSLTRQHSFRLTAHHTCEEKTRSDEQIVRRSTLKTMSDFAPNLRRFLVDQLQEFDAGRWMPRAGEFRYQPLYGPAAEMRYVSGNKIYKTLLKAFSRDHAFGIAIAASREKPLYSRNPLYKYIQNLSRDSEPELVVFIGHFCPCKTINGSRVMMMCAGGIRISVTFACQMFEELPRLLNMFEEMARETEGWLLSQIALESETQSGEMQPPTETTTQTLPEAGDYAGKNLQQPAELFPKGSEKTEQRELRRPISEAWQSMLAGGSLFITWLFLMPAHTVAAVAQ
jgi:hypothetical protein